MQAKLVFIGLWNFADDLGTVSGNHTFLRNRMLPYADISAAEFSGWMAEIVTHGLAGVFCYKGVEYMYISGFAKHQTINTPNYTDLLVPPKASPLYAQWLAKGARARQGAAGKQSATGVFGAEPDVVEVFGQGAVALVDSPLRVHAARVEVSGETVFFYTHNAHDLLQALVAYPQLRTLHRPANLEDLFLKLTGRQIREDA